MAEQSEVAGIILFTAILYGRAVLLPREFRY